MRSGSQRYTTRDFIVNAEDAEHCRPIIVPSIPVMMTKTAVILGTPPILCEMLIAIGVVTERGTRLAARSPLTCSHLASRIEEITAVIVPDSTPAAISAACFLSTLKFLCKGIAKYSCRLQQIRQPFASRIVRIISNACDE